MPHQHRPSGVTSSDEVTPPGHRRRGRPAKAAQSAVRAPFSKLLAGAFFATAAYVAFTSATTTNVPRSITPEVLVAVAAATEPQATLVREGGNVIVNGSVGHLFEASFSGPNRSAKQARVKAAVDAAAFAESFRAIRTHLASLRTEATAEKIRVAAVVAERAKAAVASAEAEKDAQLKLAVVAMDYKSSTSAALKAIEGAAGVEATGPKAAAEQLAYARPDAPVTDLEPVEEKKPKYAEKELWCLATAIYFESRGEAYRGQVAVAQVVLNRLGHKNYPKTICGVVFQNQKRRNACQFSFACDGRADTVKDKVAWKQAEEIARKVTDGDDYLTEVGDSTHYHATYVRPKWAPKMQKVTKIGLHVFYKFKPGWKFG